MLCATAVVARAQAQSITLNQYQGAPSPDDGFAVMRPGVLTHMQASARLHLDYANDPLVFEDVAGQAGSERTSVVRDQLTANLALALGLYDAWMIYAGLPVDLLMKGDTLTGLPRARGTGFGDAYVGGRFVLLGAGNDLTTQIALDAQLTMPSAKAARDDQQLAGESKVSGVIRAMLEASIATLRVGVVAGLRFRPDAELGGIQIRDQVLMELSLTQPLVRDRLFAHLELFGKSAQDDFGRTATTPISALLGMSLRHDMFTFGLAGGAGIMRGYGAPDARVVLSFAITHPRREPSAPQAQAEPEEEEPAQYVTDNPIATEEVAPTVAAEPAPVATRNQWRDADDDGMRDDDDQCPRAPGDEAHNGCPEDLRLDLDAGVIELLSEIKFGRGGTQVLGRSFETLEQLQAILNANPDMHLRIESHTHNEASTAAGYNLTQARAGSIRDLLLEWGVGHERLTAYGCGASRPIASNDRSAGRKQNERIELHIEAAGAAAPQACRPSL